MCTHVINIELEGILFITKRIFQWLSTSVNTNLRGVGQLAVDLQVSRLVGGVLQHYVCLAVLVLPQANQNDVADTNPHLLAHLAANVTQPLHTIVAVRVQAAVAEHLQHLGVLCIPPNGTMVGTLRQPLLSHATIHTLAILLEDQVTLLLVLVLATAPVLATLACQIDMRRECLPRGKVAVPQPKAYPCS